MADIDKARAVFDSFDLDHDGAVTAAELSRVLADLGGAEVTEAQAQELLGRQDADRDGTVSFDEFWAAYQRNNA